MIIDMKEANRLLRERAEAQRIENISWCNDVALFRDILQSFPTAPVRLRLRNFTDPNDIKSIEVRRKGLGSENRVYCSGQTLANLFPELRDWVTCRLVPGKRLPINAFLNEGGEDVARLIGRPLSILHQYGSGDQASASHTEYGPYWPALDDELDWMSLDFRLWERIFTNRWITSMLSWPSFAQQTTALRMYVSWSSSWPAELRKHHTKMLVERFNALDPEREWREGNVSPGMRTRTSSFLVGELL